ncbi:hypothetical protein RUM44_009880 [Polyplax serrata]|uniref:Uncharacterized protein n=1 Tax=Polyplax serrata TaxID=468196 RepID=A0ABR1ATX5_POLSC
MLRYSDALRLQESPIYAFQNPRGSNLRARARARARAGAGAGGLIEMLPLQSNPYALKDGGSSTDMSAWTSAGLQTTPGYYPYDPALAAYG